MPQCKECYYFKEINGSNGTEGYCSGHDVSVQKVPAERDSANCPINNYRPKQI
jgi:hypothetical protein